MTKKRAKTVRDVRPCLTRSHSKRGGHAGTLAHTVMMFKDSPTISIDDAKYSFVHRVFSWRDAHPRHFFAQHPQPTTDDACAVLQSALNVLPSIALPGPAVSFTRRAFAWVVPLHPLAQRRLASADLLSNVFRSPAGGSLRALVAQHVVHGRLQ